MVNLITNHIDIWTSAQTQKTSGAGRGNSSANHSLHGIKKLRELILELAVRGKLVPQDPNDEPASVLLEKIAKEKARLIKEGKIKKQEPLPEISEDEKPFELPRGWEWVRLGGVTEFVNGYAFKSSDFSDTGVGIVKIGDIHNGEITTASMSRVEENIVAGLDDSLKVNNGDMLIAMSGATTGKLGFNRTNEVFYINQRVGKIIPCCLYVEYLYHPLTTKISENLAKSMGSAIPNLSTAQIKDIVFALPPLPEQHRIVAKVVELMALCDKLEQQQTDSNVAHQTLVETLLAILTSAANQDEFVEAWQRIANHFDILFITEQSIDQLKQTILQLAVMGKLVPQDPTDEPAIVLLKIITAERSSLVKEGKIKEQKPLPSVADDEIRFELPESWEWTRLGVLGHTQTGTTPSTAKSEYFGKGYPFIKPADITDKGVVYDGDELTEAGMAVGRLIPNGSALMVCIGGSIGKVGYVDRVVSCNQQINTITPFARIDVVFLAYWLKSLLIQKQVLSLAPQTTLPILSKGKWELLLFPLPPLAEQHRIVAKVNELMALCDTLKAHINAAQTTQIQLANAIVEQAAA